MGDSFTVMYHRGTLSQFNSWHATAMAAEGIPPEGKVGYINGEPAPTAQRTVAYSAAIQNPDKSDEYCWLYGKYRAGNINCVNSIPESWLPDYVAPSGSTLILGPAPAGVSL